MVSSADEIVHRCSEPVLLSQPGPYHDESLIAGFARYARRSRGTGVETPRAMKASAFGARRSAQAVLAPADIDAGSLIERLTDPAWRADLYATIAAEQGSYLPVTNAFEETAPRAAATPDALEGAVTTVLADNEEFIAYALVSHPEMPEAFLLELCDCGQCLAALAHRRSPLALLERVAAEHGYDEAILTVGLEYYTNPCVPVGRFAAFADRYRDHSWLVRTLAEVDASSAEKQALYEDLLGDHEKPAAFHARYLARSRVTPSASWASSSPGTRIHTCSSCSSRPS